MIPMHKLSIHHDEKYFIRGLHNLFQRRHREIQKIKNSNEALLSYFEKLTDYQKRQILEEPDPELQYSKLQDFAFSIAKNLDIYDQAVQKLHQEISLFCIRRINIFNSECFEEWFEVNINCADDIIPSDEELKLKLQSLLDELIKSVRNCYIITPLPFATISKSISLGINSFIINPYGKNQHWLFPKRYKKSPYLIGKIISKCLGMGKDDKRISNELSHFESFYSPYITNYPLLVVKFSDIYENALYYGTWLSSYVRNCIQVILISLGEKNDNLLSYPIKYKEVEHIFIGSDKDAPTSRHLIFPQRYFAYNMKALISQAAKDYFSPLFLLWDNDSPLAICFRRSLRFFCWDADPKAQTSEHLSIKIQMLFTAIEILLLGFSKIGEKKKKIALIMGELYTGNVYTRSEIANSVNTLYLARSHYIHSGEDSSRKYRPHIDDSFNLIEEDRSLRIVEEVFANLLIDFPTKEAQLLNRSTGLEEWQKKCKSIAENHRSF